MSQVKSPYDNIAHAEMIIDEYRPTTTSYVNSGHVDKIDTMVNAMLVYIGMYKSGKIRGHALKAKLFQMLLTVNLMGKREL